MKVSKLLIGCDPEGFFRLKGGNKTYESAHGLLPGTKEEPYKVEGGAVQVDGMAWEYNIDPASTEKEFVDNNLKVMNAISKMAPDYNMVNTPVCWFSDRVWDSSPEEALILGCEPDYNAYTGEVNPTPNQEERFRSASGHIHIGWTEGQSVDDPSHFEACRMMAMQLDYLLGIPSLIMEGPDGSKRRQLYGKAGCFRPKPYGMEYRTLSNFWVGDEEMLRWVYQQVNRAFNLLMEGTPLYKKKEELLQSAIDSFSGSLRQGADTELQFHWPEIQFPHSLVTELKGEVEDNKLKWITPETAARIRDTESLWKTYIHDTYNVSMETIEKWANEFEAA